MANTDKEQINWQLAQMSAEVKELWLAAQQGDVEAQFKLGKAYYDVEGVAAGWNEEETAYWFRQAAEQGHIQAQYLYIGLKSDDEQAVDWLRQLAEQGYAEAQLDLARAYQRGQKGIAQDHEQGIYWLRQAAEQEDVVTELTPIRISVGDSAQNEARQELGIMYQFGDKAKGVTKDYEQALFWYQKAVEHGSSLISKSEVEFIQQEMQRLKEWRQGAEQGDAEAQYCLAVEEESYGHEEKALYWYKESAEQGHIKAQLELAVLHETGRYVEQNDEQTVYWYRQIVEREFDETQFKPYKLSNELEHSKEYIQSYQWHVKEMYVEAQFNLGYAYDSGKGITQNDEQAIYWYRKAAEQGHKRAQFCLGCAYSDGQGCVPKDDEQAVYWYQQAAEDFVTNSYRDRKGDIDAQFNLACAYEKGEGVSQDDGKAVYWYAKVAGKGDADAQLELGKIYEKADIAQDYEQLISWYRELKVNDFVSRSFVSEKDYEHEKKRINQQLDKAQAHYIKYQGPKGYKEHVVFECKKIAADWYQKAAEQGYSKALLYLGVQAEKDTDESIRSLCQLAVNSIFENENYDELELSDIDDENAIASLRDKAELGLSVAQTVLAYLYKTGNGVNQDKPEAFFWFEKGGQQQDIVAQYWLGKRYFEEQRYEKAQDYFQQVTQNRQDGDYDELDMARIESFAKDELLVLQGIQQGIQQERKITQQREDIMAMFAHKFRGPLQSIEYLEKDERILEEVRVMGGLLDIFSLISTDAEKLRDKLLQDMGGDSTLLSVLEQALVISLASVLTLNNREKIRQHYLNYAKKTGLVPVSTTRKQWKSNHLDLELQLQADWQRSFIEIKYEARLDKIITWLDERFFPVEIPGFAEASVHFERYGTTESMLLVIMPEIFTNALKYYASETRQAVQLHWVCDAQFCQFVCANPTTYKEQRIGKGSGKGHQFLSIIAGKLGGDFPLPPSVEDYVVKFSMPSHLLT